ncbi:malate dehydrogenase [Candidatus Micrarchaeota archaeon]|nr:malate dehydrogenase [Candidatus Micrarchaeota archaeon]
MKLSVIGAGRLGSLIAYSIAITKLADEILLVDVAKELAKGQASDLTHAYIDYGIKISDADYEQISDSDIIIISAGRPRQPGQTRSDLARINSSIISNIGEQIAKHIHKAIVITLTNPTDSMNYLLYRKTNLPAAHLIGSSSLLDSSRFKTVLSQKYQTNGKNIDAIVIGEHGEYQMPYFSGVKINGKKLEFTKAGMDEIKEEVRKSAISVIEKKGLTEFAPAVFTTQLAEAVIKDQKRLLPCSCILNGQYGLSGLSIGVPAIIGRNGIEKIVEVELSSYEREIFEKGASSIKKIISETSQ